MKITIVTGASSGIGLATSLKLLAVGCKVYGISKTKPDIDSENFVWIDCDLSSSDGVRAAVARIEEEPIDLFFSNAGVIFETIANHVSTDEYDKMFSVNTLAPMILSSLLGGKISRAVIISTSSVSDRVVNLEHGLYSASKAANTRYFEALALALPNARVYTLLPSYVDTPMIRNAHPEPEFDWSEPMTPDQVAELVIKLFDGEIELDSGSNIIVVNNRLLEDAHPAEKLYEYNVDNQTLTRLD